MDKKILICGSILAVIMLTLPFSSTIDVKADVDIESRENFEIGTLDNNKEIISFISGTFNCQEFKGIRLIIRHVEIWAGEFDTSMDIRGIKRSFPIRYSVSGVTHLIAPRFIGYAFGGPQFGGVQGIALGNIEWEK